MPNPRFWEHGAFRCKALHFGARGGSPVLGKSRGLGSNPLLYSLTPTRLRPRTADWRNRLQIAKLNCASSTAAC